MPKLNVQQNNQNVIQSLANGVAIGRLNGIIKCDGANNFTVEEPTTVETQTYGEFKIRKYGKVVVANGYVTNLAITGSSTNLPFTINPQFRPTEGIRTIANIGTNAYSVNTIAYVTITTAGVISVSPPSGSTGNTYTTFYGNFSWIIA